MADVYHSKMLYFCPGGICKQPNVRCYSLNDRKPWPIWKSSDGVYPEMIPEPDYTDSGEDAGSEDEEHMHFTHGSKLAQERLRDLTEVYVANVDVRKKPVQTKKTPGPAQKAASKQLSKTPSKPRATSQSDKISPRTSPKVSRTKQSKSPARVSGLASTTKGKSRSPESTKRAPTNTKVPIKASRSKSAISGRSKSPEDIKRVPGRTKSPAKAEAKGSQSKPIETSKVPQKGKTSPKSTRKTKAISVINAETNAMPTATDKETGRVQKVTLNTDISKSPASSMASTERSSDEEQFIQPKKLYQPSVERQRLHKELQFSQKYGKPVSSKTELQLALERHTENKMRRELNAEEKSSLEKILEYQAKKIEMQEEVATKPSWIDRLQNPAPTWPNSKADEFYRVHAKVVSSNNLTHCFLPDDDYSESSSSKTLHPSDSGSD